MDLSMKWLSDYVDIGDMSIKELCSGLTMSGSKVEKYDTEGSEISRVVVGKILDVKPHENSDHLVVCQVDVGKAGNGEPILPPTTSLMQLPTAYLSLKARTAES